ncbi:CDP-glycerol glycerophosphotransferase [Micromonospora pattaloongensis]|uniref:CDP-glycerol glycerophosphotransferase n=1 Tax=Micromonospora pattaloongensis TaxID=405436 RepID=A0A1H3SL79_9ACTN|nr:glycosyltransferase family 2 protein [Micromonospora pattaloongensis]SDZ38335.1 CDP-glycerol glycerophosphotransferase [Micromonospora pattaloongensis]
MPSVLAVVPIHNVRRYLPECLDSLARQSHHALDVVLVDDGSTDDSAEIAQRWVERDRRFRLIRQPNRGLGAARNAGLRAGHGDYLTFVDSDDVLPPTALEVLVGALERTGSDFASGNVGLLTSRGVRQSPLHRGTHRTTRLGIALREQRNLVYDRLACNKVFRRSFWQRHGLRFPEGVRYEDIPVTVPAYALARAVDVIELPVYYWRQREAGAEPSISQRQNELRNVVDRFAAVESARRALAGIGEGAMKDWYDETALQSDLRMFLHLLPDVGDVYRQMFLDLAADYLAGVDARVLDRLPPPLRVAWRLVQRRMIPELLTVVSASRDSAVLPVVRRGRRHYQALPYLDAGRAELPRELYRVADPMRTQVHELRWHAGRLRVRGHAYDPATGAARPWSSLRGLWLRDEPRRRRRVVSPSLPRRSPDAPTLPPRYAWSGFQVSIDPAVLRVRRRWVEQSWRVVAAAIGPAGLQRRPMGVGEIPPPLPAAWVAPDVRVVPLVRDRSLRLVVERWRVRATSCRRDGDHLVVAGESAAPADPDAALWLCRAPGVPWRRYPVTPDGPGTRFTARIPLADVTAGASDGGAPVGAVGDEWLVEFAAGDEARALPVSAGYLSYAAVAAARTVLAEPGDAGVLWIRSLPAGPLLARVRGAPAALLLSGPPPPTRPGFELVLRFRDETPARPAPPDRVLPVRLGPAGWRATLRCEPDGGPLAAGHWWLLQRPAGPDTRGGACDLPVTLRARERLPARSAGARLWLEPDRHRRLVLRVAG